MRTIARLPLHLTMLYLFVLATDAVRGDEPSPGALLRKNVAVRLEIASGRIACPALGRASNRSFSNEHGEIKETLNINSSSDEPSLSYRFISPNRDWSFDLNGNGGVRLQDKSAAETFLYEQHDGKPLSLTLRSGTSTTHHVVAGSLWHWLVFSPETCDLLLPRLNALRADWGLPQQAVEVRAALIKTDHRTWMQRRKQWERSVAALGDADYQKRQTAERSLRAGGAGVAAFLEMLDGEELGREQHRRIARVIAAAARDVDEPSTVAAAWCFDAEVWCRLLQDDDAEVRGLAAGHLGQLLSRPLVFDPSAQPPIRTAQVQIIEETLLRR